MICYDKFNIVDFLDKWILDVAPSPEDCADFPLQKKSALIDGGIMQACVYEFSEELFHYTAWDRSQNSYNLLGVPVVESGFCSSLDEAMLLSTILYLNGLVKRRSHDDDGS